MKIKRLYLQNFKSYKEETINFDEGINCILGNNGAGKSTIIEAIGYAMFNYNIFSNKKKYIRYGETKAKIELDYVANDGVEYKIIRTLSTNDSVKIINQNTQEVIEDVSNVYPYISKTLGLKQERSLANLFEEIIAVPQGEFVTLFLMKDSDRKKKFDDLFNLKIYEDLFNKSSLLVSKNKDNKNAVEKVIEGHKGETKDLEDIRKDVNDLAKDIENKTNEYNQNVDKKDSLERIINSQQEIDNKIKTLTKEINELEIEKVKNKAALDSAEKEKESIDLAVDIITKTKEDYDKFLDLEKKIKEQEQKEILYNSELAKVNKNKERLIVINGKEDGYKNTITLAQNRIDGLTLEVENNKPKIAEAKNNLIAANKALDSSKKALEDLNNIIDKHIENRNKFNDKYNQYTIEYKCVSKYSILNKIDLEKEQEKLSNNKLEQDKLNSKLNEVKDTISKQKYIIENIQKNMEDLSNGKCPILKNKCLNLSENASGNLFKLLGEENAKLNQLTTKENSIIEELKRYENNDKMLQENSEKFNRLNEYNEAVNNIINNVKNDINNVVVENKFIDDIFNDIDRIITDLENTIESEKSKVNVYKNQVEEDSKLVNDCNSILIKIQALESEKYNSINEARKEINEAEKGSKEFLNEKEKLIKENNESAFVLRENETAAAQKLIFKNSQENLKDNYELYIKNLETASKQESNKNIIKEYSEKFKNVSTSINDKTTELSKESEAFDAKEFEKNKQTFSELKATIIAEDEAIKLLKKNYANSKSKLEYKEGLLIEISKLEKQRNKYDKVEEFLNNARQILKNLPIELSRQYRENISCMATIYYQRISKENVTINIDETYRVLVIDNSKKENVKDMTQLSGGEQMSLAISIRISMLKYFAGIDVYFLDEPTVNLDKDRRFEIAEVIKDYSKELRQLFVISHDDTFESITTNILKLEKNNNESELSIE